MCIGFGLLKATLSIVPLERIDNVVPRTRDPIGQHQEKVQSPLAVNARDLGTLLLQSLFTRCLHVDSTVRQLDLVAVVPNLKSQSSRVLYASAALMFNSSAELQMKQLVLSRYSS